LPLGHSFDPIFVTWLLTIGLIIAGLAALIAFIVWAIRKAWKEKSIDNS
jgi:uncharacterized membrane protein